MEKVAIYTVRIKNSQAEEILEQIDEMFLWLENLFPSIEVEV